MRREGGGKERKMRDKRIARREGRGKRKRGRGERKSKRE